MYRNLRTIAGAAAVAAALLGWTRHADAQGAGGSRKASIAIVVDGPDWDVARETANEALGDERVPVDAGTWRQALAQQGQRSSIGRDMRDSRTLRRAVDRLR